MSLLPISGIGKGMKFIKAGNKTRVEIYFPEVKEVLVIL
jgi:hypothetical protein